MDVLILTVGDSFNLGDLATIEIKDINKGQVRLGIDAPRSVQVHRLEVYLKIHTESLETNSNENPTKNSKRWY